MSKTPHEGKERERRSGTTYFTTSLDPYLSMSSTNDFTPKRNLECIRGIGRTSHSRLTIRKSAHSQRRSILDRIADDGLEW